MRVLISGVAGFIGSHLADYLIEHGHEVVGADNFITGDRRNIAHLAGNPHFKLIEHDVTAPLKLDGPVDQVYHLASPASPAAYSRHRIATMKVNSRGTWNLLELAVDKGARLLVASTSEIYGEPAVSPQREDHWGNVNPVGLRSMYEEAKRFSEACAMAYHRERDADTRIVRIFNCYGPRLPFNDGRAITSFVQQAVENRPLTVFGDGTRVRTICYVSDVVRGMSLAMESDFHEPINLGSNEEVSMVQLAKEILGLVPESSSRITFEPGPAYDPRVRIPDISRAKQILGWTPKVPRTVGLARVVEYYRQFAVGGRQ